MLAKPFQQFSPNLALTMRYTALPFISDRSCRNSVAYGLEQSSVKSLCLRLKLQSGYNMAQMKLL